MIQDNLFDVVNAVSHVMPTLWRCHVQSFIAKNSSSVAGSELSKLRSSKRHKSNVDRKASKGRKLRFTAHPKLENFMFPRENHSKVQIDVDRLFSSLFQ